MASSLSSIVTSKLSHLYPTLKLSDFISFSSNKIIHTMSCYSAPSSNSLTIIRISPVSPQSEVDFFIYQYTHILAEFILTTGEILRSEKEYHTDIRGPYREHIVSWGKEYLQDRSINKTIILSKGKQSVDVKFKDHIILKKYSDRENYIYDQELKGNSVESLSLFLKTLVSKFSITIDAGITTTLPLYKNALLGKDVYFPDVLFLSIYKGNINDESIGGEFIAYDELLKIMDLKSVTYDNDWSFHLFTKKI